MKITKFDIKIAGRRYKLPGKFYFYFFITSFCAMRTLAHYSAIKFKRQALPGTIREYIYNDLVLLAMRPD